jgi:hypothetical protein
LAGLEAEVGGGAPAELDPAVLAAPVGQRDVDLDLEAEVGDPGDGARDRPVGWW